jgi:predicted permease
MNDMTGLIQDVRHALRQMRKSPGFAAAAIIVLALGIGATTGMLAVVQSVLVRPLNYRDANRLALLGMTNRVSYTSSVSYDDFQEMQRSLHQFEQLAAYRNVPVPVQTDDGAQMIAAPSVTTNFFDLLGVHPILGRGFQEGDEAPGAGAAMVSEAFWKNSMHGIKNVLGSKLKVHGDVYTVVGVMPASFQFPMQAGSVWTTLQFAPRKNSDVFDMWRSDTHTVQFMVIGRLKPGATLEQARSEGDAFLKHKLDTNSAILGSRFSVFSYQESVTSNERPALFALLAACLLVLLIAIVNTANLQIARATKRETEMAMRIALGASRVRILRQMIVECLVLSGLGAGIGWFLAIGFLQAARHLFSVYPRFDELRLDGLTFAACALVAALSGFVVALAPAWHLLRKGRTLSAQHSSEGHVSRRQRLSSALVTAEVALTCILLISAGLFLRTFISLQNAPRGFVSDDVMAFLLWPQISGISQSAGNVVYPRLLERLEHIPGVEAAGMTTSLPVSNFQIETDASFNIPGHLPPDRKDNSQILLTTASEHYFKAMQIPIEAGRALSAEDIHGGHYSGVVNHAFAEKFLRGVDPIGQQIVLDKDMGFPPITIVGVSGDVIQGSGVGYAAVPQVAIPYTHLAMPVVSFAVRVNGHNQTIASEIRSIVKTEAPEFAIDNLIPLNEAVQNVLATRLRAAEITSTFAWIALLLSAEGLYGVLAYLVGQRVREIGIRLALGATRENIFALIFRQGLWMVGTGLALGGIGALLASRWIRSFLFGTTAHDPATYGAVGLLVVFASAVAVFLPARRAASIEPMEALRTE